MVTKKIITILVAILLASAANARAVIDKDFYSDGVIQHGDEYSNVGVYDTSPNHTTVDMTGGSVDSLAAFDESTVNINGGDVSSLYSWESSTVNASGGTIYSLEAWDAGTVNVSNEADVFSLVARGQSGVVNMYEGSTQYLTAGEYGIINVHGGSVIRSLNAFDFGVVNVFGYGLVKTQTGGYYGYGQVYGFFTDNSPFSIDFSTSETYPHVNLVPEPSTIILFAIASLIIRRKS